MDERTLRALVSAGAIKKLRIIGQGAVFYIEAKTPNDTVMAETTKGKVKTWASLDTACKWVRALGIGKVEIELSRWIPDQTALPV